MPNDEFGDYQTPYDLAVAVAQVLPARRWGRILEPTCGSGTFLRVAMELFPRAERQGLEAQESYLGDARAYGEVKLGDALQTDFRRDFSWTNAGPLLVIGNPPWVTNSGLTALGSTNRPKRENIRKLAGIDAMTGASNFDIAESIILRLIADLVDESPTIALLCKTQVARNVLAYCAQYGLPISGSRLYEIDSRKWFGATVDACLFVVSVGVGPGDYVADVYPSLSAGQPSKQIGVIDGRLVSDIRKYAATRAADNHSPVTWRQGIKHDATEVMELVESDGPHRKSGEPVDVEAEYLFPLLKCTDVFRGRTSDITKWMIVPQAHTGDDTSRLRQSAPLLWSYLTDNAEVLDGRKSSIYRNRSRFCIFGVGEYSFAPHKVVISGMHKSPVFRLVTPKNGRPVVFDDVCYFTSFDSIEDASLTAAMLSSTPARMLLESLSFTDAKRPITKKLLQRIDLRVIAGLVPQDELIDAASALARAEGELPDRKALGEALVRLLARWASASGDVPVDAARAGARN
jgi:hypothetical protein